MIAPCFFGTILLNLVEEKNYREKKEREPSSSKRSRNTLL